MGVGNRESHSSKIRFEIFVFSDSFEAVVSLRSLDIDHLKFAIDALVDVLD